MKHITDEVDDCVHWCPACRVERQEKAREDLKLNLPWLRTASGQLLNFLQPPSEQPDLVLTKQDLVTSLANIRRYNGHADVTDLQHLAVCAVIGRAYYDEGPPFDVSPMPFVVSHDFPEIYLGDIATPLKRLLSGYASLEKLWAMWVNRQLDLPLDAGPEIETFVKFVDQRAIPCELYAFGCTEWVGYNDLCRVFGGTPDSTELEALKRLPEDPHDTEALWGLIEAELGVHALHLR